jgi:hypothetical protein
MGKQLEMPQQARPAQAPQQEERKSSSPLMDAIIASYDNEGVGSLKCGDSDTPPTWRQAAMMGKLVRAARIAPKEMLDNEAALMAAIIFLIEKKISVFSGIQSVYVINNRVTMFGSLVMGLCQGAPVWDPAGHTERFTGSGDTLTATCTMARKGGEKIEKSFSIADAKRAGLLRNATYEKYPRDMLMWRARHSCIKACFSDVTSGFSIYEVERDIAVEEPTAAPSETMRLPRRKPAPSDPIREDGLIPDMAPDTSPSEPPKPETLGLAPETYREWIDKLMEGGAADLEARQILEGCIERGEVNGDMIDEALAKMASV